MLMGFSPPDAGCGHWLFGRSRMPPSRVQLTRKSHTESPCAV